MIDKNTAGLLRGPFRKGQPVWTVVNGNPGLRYYVRPYTDGHGHILSFTDDLQNGTLYEYAVLFASKAHVLRFMINGIRSRIDRATEELRRRESELAGEEVTR